MVLPRDEIVRLAGNNHEDVTDAWLCAGTGGGKGGRKMALSWADRSATVLSRVS